MTDTAVVVDDDDARFDGLYRTYAERVAAYAARRIDHGSVDDVVADVFAIVWRRMDAVPDEPLPWLLGVARRVCANARRSASRAHRLHDRLAQERSPCPEREDPGTEGAVDPALAHALAGLSEPDQELLRLIAWEELTPREAAAALGVPGSVLKVRLHRARRRLARALAFTEAPVPLTGAQAPHEEARR